MSPIPFGESVGSTHHLRSRASMSTASELLLDLPAPHGEPCLDGVVGVFGDPLVARPAEADAQLRVQPAGLAVGAAAQLVDFARHDLAANRGEVEAPAGAVTFEDDPAAFRSGFGLALALLRDRPDA